MKYEAVFGDMSQFEGMMPDCEFVDGNYGYKNNGDVFYYCERHNEKFGWAFSHKKNLDFRPIAMRRIIKEPKRWTWEDKKAGRLPDVGSLIMEVESQDSFEFVGVCAGSKRFAVKDVLDSLIYFYNKDVISPIETQEEKAQREEDEFIGSLVGTDIHDGTVKDLFEQGARAAYRKFKGGE